MQIQGPIQNLKSIVYDLHDYQLYYFEGEKYHMKLPTHFHDSLQMCTNLMLLMLE